MRPTFETWNFCGFTNPKTWKNTLKQIVISYKMTCNLQILVLTYCFQDEIVNSMLQINLFV